MTDLTSLKAYMRSNSFKTDPFSGGSAFGAICGRGDVDPSKPKARGCNDAKVGQRGSLHSTPPTSFQLAALSGSSVCSIPRNACVQRTVGLQGKHHMLVVAAAVAAAPACVCVCAVQVTSYRLAMANAAEAVSGPTLGTDGSLQPFSWSGPWSGVAHRGMPDRFNFEFELHKPLSGVWRSMQPLSGTAEAVFSVQQELVSCSALVLR